MLRDHREINPIKEVDYEQGRSRSQQTGRPCGEHGNPTTGNEFSAVAGIGYIFPMGDKLQGYVNLKGYWEFAAHNRPEGWNTWLTFAISPAAPEPAAPKPIVRKY